ncbi:substrate-binding periplasmic protein [Acerihabitans arboris]|uniref:Transporter substrate-binding domain-containing protein n=1 Tax=Acerihabitans arboris TaxID=2691583 RepID=A0A845SHB2_9GAMM|nr:transporter substrate-binding domain-containing protein [Acerihabitans arboris]NDL62011.1 transporter substrate-binding domain-containing protein [Acerihabitans arboris]
MKFRMTQWVAASTLALGMLFGLTSMCAAASLQDILGGKVVRIGAVNAPPWYQKDLRTNEWTGLVPDIAQALFQSTGVNIEYIDTQWGTAVAGLQSDRFDLLGGFNNTPERAKAIDFTRPMGAHKIGILTLANDAGRYATWDAVNSASVKLAAIDGSAAVTLLQPRLVKTQWVIVPTSDAMQLELESGRANALLTNDIQMSQYIAKRGRGTMIIPTPVQEQPTNIGLRKDRAALREWLDQRLDSLEKDGTLDRIWSKYIVQATKP